MASVRKISFTNSAARDSSKTLVDGLCFYLCQPPDCILREYADACC